MGTKRWCILVLILSVAFVEQPERLVWEEDRLLQWSDFKGKPDYLLDYAATTNSGMSHSYMIDAYGVLDKSSSTVLAHFYPSFSWCKPSDTTAVLLRHEQTHFDITEVYARKLRKLMQEYPFTVNSQEEVKKVYAKVEEARRATQQLYDRETDHSRKQDQEIVWRERIRDSLEKYWVYTP